MMYCEGCPNRPKCSGGCKSGGNKAAKAKKKIMNKRGKGK